LLAHHSWLNQFFKALHSTAVLPLPTLGQSWVLLSAAGNRDRGSGHLVEVRPLGMIGGFV
jgi:hypothetical protein